MWIIQGWIDTTNVRVPEDGYWWDVLDCKLDKRYGERIIEGLRIDPRRKVRLIWVEA